MTTDIVDLFSGPGGWDITARSLGVDAVGIEQDAAACSTRRRAGLNTVEGDVRQYGPLDFPTARRLIGSPPCQTFSVGGRGAGRAALSVVGDIAKRMAAREDVSGMLGACGDERTALVLEPLRWALEAIDAGMPYQSIALEQVPTALPVWQYFAAILRAEGYGVAAGCLSAEQYGVPQTRKRAVLVAQLDAPAALPAPAHRAYRKGVPQTEGDPALLPWVSMEDTFPWARDPYNAGQWIQRSNYNHGSTGQRSVRELCEPSVTVTGRRMHWQRGNERAVIPFDQAGALQSFPLQHPWSGNTTQRYQQIGNAIPPRLAGAILAEVLR